MVLAKPVGAGLPAMNRSTQDRSRKAIHSALQRFVTGVSAHTSSFHPRLALLPLTEVFSGLRRRRGVSNKWLLLHWV